MQQAQRLQKLPPYLFVEIRRKIDKAKAEGIDVLSLGVGDPDQPTPKHIIDELCKTAYDAENHRYPPQEERGMKAFRQAVAKWYKDKHGVELDPEKEIIALIGSKEGIHHLALSFVNPGDYVLVPNPAYTPYCSGTIFAEGEIYEMPLLEENGFLPKIEDIPSDIAKKSKVMFLNYPNNPTGALATPEFFKKVVDFAKNYDIIICNDGAYTEIVYEGVKPLSFLEIPSAKEVGVELNSLSKPYNMTGWRIGMMSGNADIMAGMSASKSNTDSGIFAPVQYAGIKALTGPQDNIAKMMEIYKRRRDLVVDTFNKMGWSLEKPQATFYVWIPTPSRMKSMDFADFLFEKTAIVVSAGVGYGAYGEGYFRISLTISDDRLNEAMQRIGSVKEELSSLFK